MSDFTGLAPYLSYFKGIWAQAQEQVERPLATVRQLAIPGYGVLPLAPVSGSLPCGHVDINAAGDFLFVACKGSKKYWVAVPPAVAALMLEDAINPDKLPPLPPMDLASMRPAFATPSVYFATEGY